MTCDWYITTPVTEQIVLWLVVPALSVTLFVQPKEARDTVYGEGVGDDGGTGSPGSPGRRGVWTLVGQPDVVNSSGPSGINYTGNLL